MNLTIELPDTLRAIVQAKVLAQRRRARPFREPGLENALRDQPEPPKPLPSGYGMLARYGAAPSAEEIDENRGDMFRNFAQD